MVVRIEFVEEEWKNGEVVSRPLPYIKLVLEDPTPDEMIFVKSFTRFLRERGEKVKIVKIIEKAKG